MSKVTLLDTYSAKNKIKPTTDANQGIVDVFKKKKKKKVKVDLIFQLYILMFELIFSDATMVTGTESSGFTTVKKHTLFDYVVVNKNSF